MTEWYYVDVPADTLDQAASLSLQLAKAFDARAQERGIDADMGGEAKTYGNDVVGLVKAKDGLGAGPVIATVQAVTDKPFHVARWQAVQRYPDLSNAIKEYGLRFNS